MIYEETVKLPKEMFDRINRLLAIEDLEEMTDDELLAAGANTDQHEGIYSVRFDDGSTMNYDLCSGQTNYYDDVVWTSPDGSRDVVLECAFCLNLVDEVEIGGNVYLVRIELDDDKN